MPFPNKILTLTNYSLTKIRIAVQNKSNLLQNVFRNLSERYNYLQTKKLFTISKIKALPGFASVRSN